MTFRMAALLMLLLGATAPGASVGARAPEVSSLSFAYDIFFGGFRAGELTIAAEFDRGSYRAGADFRSKGVIGWFVDTEMSVQTTGRVDAGGLMPVHFRSFEREDDEEQVIEISYAEGGPPSVHAAPAFRQKP